MGAEEIEHCRQHRPVTKAATQGIGRQPRQGQQPFRPVNIVQQPSEGGQGQCLGIGGW